jgi:pimeloyl-ACP methyl ester carboxylesterase
MNFAAKGSALLALTCASCTDFRLAGYRDDRFLAEYRYALGEQYVEAEGIKFCYQELGQGPTVLILPGLGTSIDFWQLNVPALAEHFHVVALDPPGFGKSGKPDATYELPWINQRILAFLDAKQIEQASIIGGSMGGHLGLLLALDHPERVDKLVMMGATGAWPPPAPLLDMGIKLLWNEWLVSDYMRGHWPEIYALMF